MTLPAFAPVIVPRETVYCPPLSRPGTVPSQGRLSRLPLNTTAPLEPVTVNGILTFSGFPVQSILTFRFCVAGSGCSPVNVPMNISSLLSVSLIVVDRGFCVIPTPLSGTVSCTEQFVPISRPVITPVQLLPLFSTTDLSFWPFTTAVIFTLSPGSFPPTHWMKTVSFLSVDGGV